MPELPEVETIRRGLQGCILGQAIRKVKVLEPKAFLGRKEENEGAGVSRLRRFGKALIIHLDNGY